MVVLKDFLVLRALKTCPDEEGIKTALTVPSRHSHALKTCPDEEGIKTDRLV